MKPRQHPDMNTHPFVQAWSRRWPERRLLWLSVLGIGIGFGMMLGSGYAEGRAFALTDPLPWTLYAGTLVVLHLTLVSVRFQGDQILIGALAFLAGFGLLAQVRLGTFDVANPLDPGLYLVPAGIVLMLLVAIGLSHGRYARLTEGHWLWVWAAGSLVLVAVVLLFGQRYRGAVYGVGLVTPTELLKVTVVVFLAGFIDRHAKRLANWGKGFPLPPMRHLWPLLLFCLGLSALLLTQRDLGMVVILSVALLVMLFFGTGRTAYLVLGGVLAALAGALLLTVFSHGQRRLAAWLDPFQDPTGNSWQILQGLSGMYSGGLWGEGFGAGNPEYTPIAQSDFIYAVIGEELGFVGAVLLVLVFLVLFGRGLTIADQTRQGFGRLLCLGLTTELATQTLLNLGGVTKSIPLTGVTLPFISHGGSSLMTSFVMLGLILAVSDGMPARRRTPKPPRPPSD